MKQSTPTALKVWLNGSIMSDGNQTSDASAFTWTKKFPTYDFTSNWSGGSGSPPDDNNHMYIDEFEVFSNSQWSLGSWDEATTGLMSDGTIAVAASSPTTGNFSLR